MNEKTEKTYPVEAIEIEVRGKKEPCYVRELTSGQVESIFAPIQKDQKDSKSTFLMRKRIVALSVCTLVDGSDENNLQGTRKYANDAAVDEQPNSRINAEFGAAAEHNALGKDEAKAGKVSEAESD